MIESSYTASNATLGFHTTYLVPYVALLQIRRSAVGSQRRAIVDPQRDRQTDTIK
jgi:hypothetical protein